MSVDALYDELGPRARARVRVATVVTVLLLAGLVAAAVRRFADKGQLEGELWEPYLDSRVLRFLGEGLLVTMRVALVAMLLALVIGALLAVGRLSGLLPARLLSGAYIEVFRALPLLLLIYFFARGLDRQGIGVDPFWQIVLPLVAYNSAVLAEIFRAGILSLDRGQSEAAYAVGLTYGQAMRLVVLPQAVRRMLPALISQSVTLLKDTSLAFVIPYEEFLHRSSLVATEYLNYIPAFVVAACVYIAICSTLSRFARRLEARQTRRFGGTVHVAGVEDLAVLEGAGVVAQKGDAS